MATITWQDGFEGAEDLNTVYGAGNVSGASISVGNGRSGGNALVCSGSGLSRVTGIGLATDPIQIGLARNAGVGGNANIGLSDGLGTVAQLQVDSIGNIDVVLYLSGFPTYSGDTPRIGGIWRYVEWFFKADPANGRLAAAVDGETVLDVSGIKTADAGRGPVTCGLNGSAALIDDWYMETGDATPTFKGDYVVSGTAPSASGSVPTPGPVRVDQQFITVAQTAPKPTVRVDQQFIILAIKRKPGAPVRPQVFGVGRV